MDAKDREADLATLLDDLGDPLDPVKYDWSLATRYSLSDDEVFQLTYAAQVEWATEGTFASLNITRDPIVRRFLRIWLKQEVMHGQLLARLLEANGVRVEVLHRTRAQRFAAWRGQMVNRLARIAVGKDFFGVHMAWGAVNELTVLRFYALMRERTQHPLLAEILRDLMVQEAAHYSFYKRAAIDRLEGNPRGQKMVRFAMRKLWRTVGAGLRSPEDADRIMVSLLSDEPKLVAVMDGALERIPGMENLHLLQTTLDEARARIAKLTLRLARWSSLLLSSCWRLSWASRSWRCTTAWYACETGLKTRGRRSTCSSSAATT